MFVALRLVGGLLLFGSGIAAAAAVQRIPVEAFAADAEVGQAALSPDGTRIAAVSSAKGSDLIFVIDPEAPEKVLRRITIGKTSLEELSWAGKDRVILKLSSDAAFLGLLNQTVLLVVVDINTGSVRQLTEKDKTFLASEVLFVAPDGKYALIAGRKAGDRGMSVKNFNLATGESTMVQPPISDVWSWFVDGQGIVRGGLAHGDYRWTIYYRTKAAEPLTKFTNKFDDRHEDIFESVYFSPIGGESVVVSNHVTGRFAAYRLNLETVEPGTLIFENPQGDIESIVRDGATGKVVGIRYHDERWRTHWIDPQLARAQAKIDGALKGSENRIVDYSRDRGRMLVRSARPDDPGVYFLFDRQKGELKTIFAQIPAIPETSLSPTRFVRYQARDGLMIPAFLTLPKDRPGKNLPLVVMPHGGPFARDTWEYDPMVQLLANRGYAVLQPQFRGTTGFGRDFVERGYGQWGRKMQDDLDDGFDWLVSQGTADPKRVCIFGGSYGGYAAIWGAIRNPERYRCAISWAGVTDLRMMLKHDRTLFVARRYYRDWRERVTGINGKENLDQLSPVKQARRLRVPLLVGHGRKDSNVPVAQAEELAKALGKSGIAVDTSYYPESGHNFWNTADFTDWLKKVEAFLARHNPADPAAALPAPKTS